MVGDPFRGGDGEIRLHFDSACGGVGIKIAVFASVCTGSRTGHRPVRYTFESLQSLMKKIPHRVVGDLFHGGDGEIRTLEELLTPTRFPIVRARPTTRHLRVAQETSYSLDSLDIISPHSGKVKEYFALFSGIERAFLQILGKR